MLQNAAVCMLFLAATGAAQPLPGPSPQLGIEDPPLPIGAVAQRLTAAGDGLILSYLQGGSSAIELRFIRLTESGWGEPVTVAASPKMLANWADVPGVVEGGDGALYAHWLLPTANTGESYDIRVHRSADGGATWNDLGVLHDDGVVAEHGFVSYVPEPGGVRAYWLDGRETSSNELGLVTGPMTLRTAVIGETVGPSELVDGRVCDCCTTGAAMTDAGPVVVYRDRTEDEVRDIWIATASGTRVLQADGWVIPGCPVNGPAIDAAGSTVAVAWFTAASEKVRVYAAISTDSGASFSPAVLVDETRGRDAPLGRVDVVLDGGEAVVSWLATRQKAGAVMLQRVSAGGLVGGARELAPMDAGRLSGFPEMERLGDRVVVVWRDPEAKTLRAASLGLEFIGR